MTDKTVPILIVDDEEQALMGVEFALRSSGFTDVTTESDSRKVEYLLEDHGYTIVLLDLMMPHVSGQEILQIIEKRFPTVIVIIVTAVGTISTAVDCIKMGAFDYLQKPVNRDRLVSTIMRAVTQSEFLREHRQLTRSLLNPDLQDPDAFADIVTQNTVMKDIFRYIEAISGSSYPILITGETGTGKELIARAVHEVSGRSGKLVSVNIAGLADGLVADTLFGHRKGAFTGADADREGIIEQAQDGTIFLDEIGDLGQESQIKLLRLLQDKTYFPLGSDTVKITNARVVVATHHSLEQKQKEGTFRADLFFRLQTHHIKLPALRERADDIPMLVDHFLTQICDDMSKKKPYVPKELYTLLSNYQFPGNIRELESMIVDSVSQLESGILALENFKKKMMAEGKTLETDTASEDGTMSLHQDVLHFPKKLPPLREIEHLLIEEALERCDGNQTLAAELLQVSRQTLNTRIVKMRQKKS